MDLVEIWQNTLGELQVSLSKPNFETWFKNTFIFEYKKGVFTIGVPTIFVESWLKSKHAKDIQKALQNQIDEPILGTRFKVAAPKEGQVVDLEIPKVIHKTVDNHVKTVDKDLPVPLPQNSSLNDNYIFKNFIVGPSNQLAFAAAQAVAEKPGTQYNPLFIYGDSGLGKTHLMQAIGHAYLSQNPDKKVLYVSTETFINDFIQAVGSGFGKAKDFKNRYRNVDLLLIDDVQFLSSKEGTQDEFFHTFNHLHQNKKQVILTSDRIPKDIKGLEVRLKTRFEGGMVCDIGHPDLETREAILQQKAQQLNKKIDEKIITFIAEKVKSSVRELEGALNKVIATCELTHCELTLEKTADILDAIIEEKQQHVTPELVIREVHKYFRIPIEELLGKKRTKELVMPRQITMYLLRSECNLSYPEIGRKMGGKDHSTIMHGEQKIGKSIATDSRLKEDLTLIKDRIFTSYN